MLTQTQIEEIIQELKDSFESKEGKTLQITARSRKAVELALNGESFFISGNAGTGKTTLLNSIIVPALISIGRKCVVLAPTGIAAQNANGATIHSLLRLPLTPYFPNKKNRELYRLKPEEEVIVKKLNVIIIDEISMVRCDMMDAIDDILRHYRKSELPFGGVQMVFMGDLYQLMPVATEEEWNDLKKIYKTIYFFSSLVLQKNPVNMLELKTVYRQNTDGFKNILNCIRDNTITDLQIYELNKRVNKDFNPLPDDQYIRLCSLNRTAWGYNHGMLEKIKGEATSYKAVTTGWFPLHEYPTDYNLKLKVGAKVMFVSNDTKDGQYVNGTIGYVTSLHYDYVMVETKYGASVAVRRQKYDFIRYHIHKDVIEKEICGTFTQFPLKLAWAITIHKCQGLTISKPVIDLSRVFTYGQVYVALSRCTSIDNLVLTSKVTKSKIMIDPEVNRYMKWANKYNIDDSKDKELQSKLRVDTLGREDVLYYAQQGLNVQGIQYETQKRIEFIYKDLSVYIEKGIIDVHRYVRERDLERILDISKRLNTQDVKVIKEHFNGFIKYGEISMALASLKAPGKSNIVKASKEQKPINKIKKTFEKYVPTLKMPLSAGCDLLIEVPDKTFQELRTGKMKVFKKGIVNQDIANDFLENPESYNNLNASYKLLYKAKPFKTLKFCCKDEILEIEVKGSKFFKVNSSNYRSLWCISITLGDMVE